MYYSHFMCVCVCAGCCGWHVPPSCSSCSGCSWLCPGFRFFLLSSSSFWEPEDGIHCVCLWGPSAETCSKCCWQRERDHVIRTGRKKKSLILLWYYSVWQNCTHLQTRIQAQSQNKTHTLTQCGWAGWWLGEHCVSYHDTTLFYDTWCLAVMFISNKNY